jgi:archaellum component FlaC
MFRTSPDIILNSFLIFGSPDSERFAISGHRAVSFSPALQALWLDPNENDQIYQIRSTVSPKSFLEFIKPFRSNEQVAVDWETASDLYCLCDEFKVESLRCSVEAFILSGSCSTSNLISIVLSLCERGISTTFLEAKLRDNVISLIRDQRFSEVPLSVLERVIDFRLISDRSSYRELLEFCIRFVDHSGVGGSTLFRTLEFGRLTPSDILFIGDSRRFVYPFMSDSAISSLIDSQGFKCEAEGRLTNLEKAICELKTSVESVELSVNRMKADQASFVRLMTFDRLSGEVEEMKRISAGKTDLVDLESRCVSKADFSAFEGKMSGEFDRIGSTYATRSDVDLLRSSSAAKSEVESLRGLLGSVKAEVDSLSGTVALKRELNSMKEGLDSATRSEFDSLKSKIESLKSTVATKSDLAALKTSLEGLHAAAATLTKSELDALKLNTATKSELEAVKANGATKSELDSLRSTTSTRSDLTSLKTELTSFKSTVTTKSDLESLRSALTPMPWIPFFAPPGPSKRWDELRASVSPYGLDKWPWLSSGPIIWLLTVRYGGNVHEKQVVNVTSSSVCCSTLPSTVADWSTDTRFHTKTEAPQWICYDFKDRTVQITHYSIRSTDAWYPRSWVLEGGIDLSGSWTTLDSQSGNSQLNGNYLVATFPTANHTSFRYIRLRQTGATHSNSNCLGVAGLELFGHVS